MDLKATYNKIAEDWFKDHNSDDWWVEGTEYLTSLLPSGASVLDIGCGAGHKSAFLIKKGLRVTGGDFSEEMIKIAKREVPGADFRVLDLYNVDSIEEKFDCVFAQAVFLHIPKKDVADIIEKIKKILKEDGLLYIAVKEQRLNSPEERVEVENDYGYEYERFFSYFTAPEVESFLREAGFAVAYSTITPIGDTRWIQVIGKNEKL